MAPTENSTSESEGDDNKSEEVQPETDPSTAEHLESTVSGSDELIDPLYESANFRSGIGFIAAIRRRSWDVFGVGTLRQNLAQCLREACRFWIEAVVSLDGVAPFYENLRPALCRQPSLSTTLVVKRSEFEAQKEHVQEQHCHSISSNSMVDIVVKDQAIPKATANDACGSLDEEIRRKRREGKLEAGIATTVSLEWTGEAIEALRAYENVFKADFAGVAPVQSLRDKPLTSKLNIGCPIVYSDVSTPPKRYISGVGLGIMGIIALGTLHLPKIGDSEPRTIESGSVAYYRDSTLIEYRECEGRGIYFYIS
ncbi:hypothetical protein G7Y89_g550 [Cudoniella acicularis]|uniref:Uncharacterized protein n=1 Tax=Cudoniella acicularis TaxID=354080 RepID=A0A8H4RWY3_9HELO|nr:hypothetical protein G7Y89_g550 [Cudoniella acicularis]